MEHIQRYRTHSPDSQCTSFAHKSRRTFEYWLSNSTLNMYVFLALYMHERVCVCVVSVNGSASIFVCVCACVTMYGKNFCYKKNVPSILKWIPSAFFPPSIILSSFSFFLVPFLCVYLSATLMCRSTHSAIHLRPYLVIFSA